MNQSAELETLQDKIEQLLRQHGPEPPEYEELLAFVDALEACDVEAFRAAMQPVLTPDTIIGFSFTKPFGYNGDFFIIEKIYQKYVNPDERYRRWDEFFHTFPAAIAVVNRKALAQKVLAQLNRKSPGKQREVLILGSGPVTEVYEYFKQNPVNNLCFDLLDLDNRSIAYAKNKHCNNLHCMNFQNQNVIRFNPEKQYDLIWSAGLFDYFKDRHFVFLIRRYYEFVKEGGEMIIGNFNIENPSRKIMEVLGDWFLYHRSVDELHDFARRAGIPDDKISVIQEPLGINLFLRLRK